MKSLAIKVLQNFPVFPEAPLVALKVEKKFKDKKKYNYYVSTIILGIQSNGPIPSGNYDDGSDHIPSKFSKGHINIHKHVKGLRGRVGRNFN